MNEVRSSHPAVRGPGRAWLKNQLTRESGFPCTYDSNGNLTQVGNSFSVGIQVYSYEYENRLTQVYTNYNSPPEGPVAGAVWETDFVFPPDRFPPKGKDR